MRTRVVLPDPFGPSRAKIDPSATLRSTPSRARVSPKDFETSTISIAAGGPAVAGFD
jgi:hypothetical protein